VRCSVLPLGGYRHPAAFKNKPLNGDAMKIEKIKSLPNSSPAFSADELVRLAELMVSPASTGWTQDGHTLSLNTEPPPKLEATAIIEQIAAMIPAATDWIESRCGVICRLTEFRITLTLNEISQRAIRLPVAPVLAIVSAKIDEKELPKGSVLSKNAHLVIDPKIKDMGKEITVDLLTGFAEGEVPHIVKVAAMMICKHWGDNSSDFENRKFQDANALQLLQMHTPCMAWPTHAMEGGSLWQ